MSVARVSPSLAVGRLSAPGSKSYTHRFLLAAHLARRPTRLRRPLSSDDTLRTVSAIQRLGSRLVERGGAWTVIPPVDRPLQARSTIDCGESGTTLRLLTAAATLRPGTYRFVGRGRLPERPIAPLLGALGRLGATVRTPASGPPVPFTIRGPIHGGRLTVAADESSQFTSALLFALPTVEPGSRLRTVGVPVSAPYVDATVAVLRARGVRVEAVRSGFSIPGGQVYAAGDATVPGDASSAAYLWAAAAVTGGLVTVEGVPDGWPQADLAILDLLRRYGSEVSRSGDSVTARGAARRPFRIVLDQAPDLYPLAGVLAAVAPGRSYLLGAAHVAAKESDRRRETARLARALGAKVSPVRGGLAVDGTDRPRAFRLYDLTDHRLVMSAAVGALAGDRPSEVGDARTVSKSFPDFFVALGRLGVRSTVR